MIIRTAVLGDPEGLHARVAHELATLASTFASSVFLRHRGQTASAAGVIGLLALGVPSGAGIEVLADGVDEQDAIDAVCRLLSGGPDPLAT